MRYLIFLAFAGQCCENFAEELLVERVSEVVFTSKRESELPDFGAFITYRNELYFTASTNDDAARYLFKTDGQTLTQLPVDPGFHIGTQFIEFQEHLYFRGDDGDGTELFRTDGNAITKIDLSASPWGSAPRNFTAVGDRLYFQANPSSSSELGRASLMSLQGTSVSVVADVQVEESYPWHFPVGNTLYFTANGPDGYELYKTDGTLTQQVIDAKKGPGDSNPWPGNILNNEFYFTARGQEGRGLYKTSGDYAQKLPIAEDPDMYGGPINIQPFGSDAYFTANVGNGYELYRTDGEEVEEYDLNPGPAWSQPQLYGADVLEGHLLIPAKGPNGLAIFVLGEQGDLLRRLDLNPNVDSQGAIIFQELNGEAIFTAIGANGRELYKTDGITLTQFDVVPDDSTRSIIAMYEARELNGELFFRASTPNGIELVKTDGTTTKTFDIAPGPAGFHPRDQEFAGSHPHDLQVIDDELVFIGTDGPGEAIYSTDGDSIQKLASLTPNSYFSKSRKQDVFLPAATVFARHGDQLLFLANTPNGFQLHRVVSIPEPSCVVLVTFTIVIFVSIKCRTGNNTRYKLSSNSTEL